MADIELIIKISEDDLKSVENKIFTIEEMFETTQGRVYSAIVKSTPLPKGHGKIIDYGYVVDAIDDWVNAEEYRYTNATDYLRKRVANTPTIIEADKES